MDDPWFITYRGRGKLQITPVNAKGWASLLAMTFASLAPFALVLPWMEGRPWIVAIPMVMCAVLWIVWCRWAIGRSEVINIDEIIAERRARRQMTQRGRGSRR